MVEITQYVLLYLVSAVAIGAVAWYAYSHRKELNEMCCMMMGMTFGGAAALAVSAIYALDTGDFVWSMILGTVAGYAVGVPMGRMGGPLGRMEAVFAAPGAAFMGGMLSIMAKLYDVKLYTIFLMLVVFSLMGEMAYVIHKTVKEYHSA